MGKRIYVSESRLLYFALHIANIVVYVPLINYMHYIIATEIYQDKGAEVADYYYANYDINKTMELRQCLPRKPSMDVGVWM